MFEHHFPLRRAIFQEICIGVRLESADVPAISGDPSPEVLELETKKISSKNCLWGEHM
jgi:hypothetical protein